jgi:hypothetical protein
VASPIVCRPPKPHRWLKSDLSKGAAAMTPIWSADCAARSLGPQADAAPIDPAVEK